MTKTIYHEQSQSPFTPNHLSDLSIPSAFPQIIPNVAKFPVSGKLILDQVPAKGIQALPEEKPRPSLYSRLFTHREKKPTIPGTGGWIPHAGETYRAPSSLSDKDED